MGVGDAVGVVAALDVGAEDPLGETVGVAAALGVDIAGSLGEVAGDTDGVELAGGETDADAAPRGVSVVEPGSVTDAG